MKARGPISVAALARTKISRDHFAFLRGWFNGLPARLLWERYLPHLGAYDERRGRSFLRTLQHELAAVARHSGQAGFAGLLGRHKDRIADLKAHRSQTPARMDGNRVATAKAPPSLDEFAAQFDEDMYSEAELIELWTQAYPPAEPSRRVRRDPSQRRARLIERQLQALDWLERHTCQRPKRGDPVDAWLDPRICSRLASSGILTLEDLADFVSRWGANWHKKVQRVGPKGAGLIVTWLQNQEDALGALPATALLPAVQAAAAGRRAAPLGVAGLVPLERLALPRQLAAVHPPAPGSNRTPVLQCAVQARDDIQAIRNWLALRSSGSHTWRAYRREAERFLLWSVFEAGKPLSGLTTADCAAYLAFLKDPDCRWLGPRNAPRWSPHWRPLEGPLSLQSIRTAVTILRSMCEWLSRSGYLDTNPWNGVAMGDTAPALPAAAVTRQQLDWVEEWLGTLPHDARSARIRLLLGLGCRPGLRRSELAAAKVEWLRRTPSEGGSWAWTILVPGRRDAQREVPLPASAVEILARSFAARGLRPNPLDNAPDIPLIASLPSRNQASSAGLALSAGRIYEVAKRALEQCAEWVGRHDVQAAAGIRDASTHWLRHAHETHAAPTAPQQAMQGRPGHPSLAAAYTEAPGAGTF